MIEFYPQIKAVHIICVLLSGVLFCIRGFGVLSCQAWPMRRSLRLLSYAIDTVLLTAALILVAILPGAMFANGWLLMKLVLLVIYVVLGSFALKRARTPRARAVCFAAAITVFLLIFTIARQHHPLGIFQRALQAMPGI